MATLTSPQINYNNIRFNLCYATDYNGLQTIAWDLAGGSWSGILNGIFTDLASFIVSIRVYPFDILTYTNNTSLIARVIQVGEGSFSSSANGYLLPAGTSTTQAYRKLMTTIQLTSDNFSDYEPYTKYTLYLPYYGFFDINANILLNNTLNIYYTVDFTNGNCAIDLCITKGQNEELLERLNCSIGFEIPVMNTNIAQNMKQVIGDGVKAITSVALGAGMAAGGGDLGIVAGEMLIAKTAIDTPVKLLQDIYVIANTKELKDDFLKWYLPQNPFIIKKKQKIVNLGNNGLYTSDYLHLNGQASEKVITLSSLTDGTYFSVKEVHIENINATDRELQEIENLLKSGVIK